MASVGILVHARHLETVGWERLMWGVPKEDTLGSLTKLVELILGEPEDTSITVVFGSGPSTKHGLSESEYAKQHLLARIKKLPEFPRFAGLGADTLNRLAQHLTNSIVMPPLRRSIDEVTTAAQLFAERDVTKVWQVASASHAPRCVQIQAAARAKGLIPKHQQWFLVADDQSYEGSDPFSTLIMEVPHRGDDPLIGFTPSLPEILRAYQYGLSPEDKQALARLVEQFMAERAEHSDVRQLRPAA